MADINKLTIKGVTSSSGTGSAGAASFTVPLGGGGDSRASLVIVNGNTGTIVRAVVSAGDGERAVLGDLTVDIAASAVGVIPLTDSMRFKVMTTNDVTVALNSTADTALTATPLGLITTVLIQG